MTGAFYDLQKIRFTDFPDRAPLYAITPEGNRLEQASIVLEQNAVLNLDTFFASFYESYWREYTVAVDVFFSIKVIGSARVQIIRQTTAGADQVVVDATYSGNGEVQRIPVPRSGVTGRLFARITALVDETVLLDMGWATSVSPRNAIALAVVICTYNREADVIAIMEKLTALYHEGHMSELIVVNNGTPGLIQRLPPHVRAMSVFVHDQENLGGSGGFGRGMSEALEGKKSSHVLLLDDDIDLDIDVLRQLRIILTYGRNDLVIGGFMLDRIRPSWLHNHVTKWDASQLKVVAPFANCDFGIADNLKSFAQTVKTDFCGWWCCALPLAAIGKAGMPLPFFLHYDDAEFGLRLIQHGQTNVSWPGIAVWHEPFYMKPHRWRRYYDFRNALFLARYHGCLGRFAALRQFALRFGMNLIQYHYDSAWATLQAMADYLRGPDFLACWNSRAHAKLISSVENLAEPTLPLTVVLQPVVNVNTKPFDEDKEILRRVFSDLFCSVDLSAQPKVIAPAQWSIWATGGHDAVAVPDEVLGTYRVYRRRPRRVLWLLGYFVWLFVLFLCGWDFQWRREALVSLGAKRF